MNADIVTMLGNLSQSLLAVQALVTGSAYLIGLLFMITALSRLKKIGDSRARGGSNEKMFIPIAYFVGGAALIYLPTAVTVLSTTTFGSGNILQYTQYKQYDIYKSMKVLIFTAGLIWFVRGCTLLVHASQPGIQHGPKGLAFVCAGVMAINFEGSVTAFNYILNNLMSFSEQISARG